MKDIISGLNKVFDSRVRLGIMSILLANETADFNAMKDLLDVTDGNLASHLKGLEKEEIVTVRKQFIGRKPNTSYIVTEYGRKLFMEHIEALEKLINPL